MIRVPDVVRIEQSDPIAARRLDAGIPGRRGVASDNMKECYRDAAPTHLRNRVVGGRIVNDDHFVRRVGLRGHAAERVRNPAPRIVAWDDDGDAHQALSFNSLAHWPATGFS